MQYLTLLLSLEKKKHSCPVDNIIRHKMNCKMFTLVSERLCCSQKEKKEQIGRCWITQQSFNSR